MFAGSCASAQRIKNHSFTRHVVPQATSGNVLIFKVLILVYPALNGLSSCTSSISRGNLVTHGKIELTYMGIWLSVDELDRAVWFYYTPRTWYATNSNLLNTSDLKVLRAKIPTPNLSLHQCRRLPHHCSITQSLPTLGSYPSKHFPSIYLSKCLLNGAIVPGLITTSGNTFHILFLWKRYPSGTN